MSKLESYEVTTVDQGYHAYVAVWEADVGQILPCKREEGNIHDPYAVAIVENNDTLIDNDAAPYSMTIFTFKTFANCFKTAKFAKVFTCERLLLYGISQMQEAPVPPTPPLHDTKKITGSHIAKPCFNFTCPRICI